MCNKLKRSLDKNFSYTEYNPKNKIQNKNDAQKHIHEKRKECNHPQYNQPEP